MQIKREHHINFWYLTVAMIAVLLLQEFVVRQTLTKTIPYSEFEQLLDQGQVSDLVVGQNQISGLLKGESRPNEPQHFSTYRVEPQLAQRLTKANLTFSGEPPPGLLVTVLGWILPSVGFLLVWMYMIRPMTGQGVGGTHGHRQEQGKDLCRDGHQGYLR